jgi:hypothetical protein
MGQNRVAREPSAICMRRTELVPLSRVRPMVGQKFEQMRESLIGVAIELDRDREVRWTGHGMIGPEGATPRGVGMDGATHQIAVFFEDGGSVVSSRARQNQWHAHRYPRFLPDS